MSMAKVCTFGVFSLGDQEATWRDAYGPGCGCTAGKLGLQVTQFKNYLTDKDSTDQMADISAHGLNKVLGIGLTGDSRPHRVLFKISGSIAMDDGISWSNVCCSGDVCRLPMMLVLAGTLASPEYCAAPGVSGNKVPGRPHAPCPPPQRGIVLQPLRRPFPVGLCRLRGHVHHPSPIPPPHHLRTEFPVCFCSDKLV